MMQDELRRRVEIAVADAGGLYSWDDLVALARSRMVQVFGNEDGIIATRKVVNPRRTSLEVMLLAGNLRGVKALEPEVEAFARAEGCHEMYTIGRGQWLRLARRHGWEPTGIQLVKDLAP